MQLEITNKDKDGYITVSIKDNEDSLTYLYSPMNGWQTVHGIVQGKYFKQHKTMQFVWIQEGRGKVSNDTWDRVNKLHEFFMNNRP